MINRSLFVCREKIRWGKESLFSTQCQGGDTCQKNKNAKRFTLKVLKRSWRLWMRPSKVCHQARQKKRLAEFGHNELEEGEKRSILVKFIEQFKDLMIIILVAAAILSVVTSGGEDIADAIIILAVVIINAAFGVYQEGKAEEAIEALKSMSRSSSPCSSWWAYGGDWL